jgi:cysteine desulfurase
MSFLHVEGETLLTGLHDVALSSGSACSSGKTEASHVLKALGLSDEAAGSAIRFGVGRFNTEAEIDYVAGRVIELVKNLREVSV